MKKHNFYAGPAILPETADAMQEFENIIVK